MPVATVAMCISFALGRHAVTRLLPRSEEASPRVAAVRRAIEADGFRVTLLLRMTLLLPQSVLTYVFATTSLRLRDFAPATALGMIPFTVFYAYVGSLVEDAAALLGRRAGPRADAVGRAGGGLVAGRGGPVRHRAGGAEGAGEGDRSGVRGGKMSHDGPVGSKSRPLPGQWREPGP